MLVFSNILIGFKDDFSNIIKKGKVTGVKALSVFYFLNLGHACAGHFPAETER